MPTLHVIDNQVNATLSRPSQVIIEAVSPHVDTEPIEGGTRVVVTDVDGVHPFDVMNGLPGHDGKDGEPGQDGYTPQKGIDYTDGVSPSVATESITGGTRVTITDAEGDHVFDLMDGLDGRDGEDGEDGEDGADGFSPSASVSKSGKIATITIIDKTGATTATISDGETGPQGPQGESIVGPKGEKGDPGPAGADGISPTASVSKSGSVATIIITDKSGTTTASVYDGQDGYTPVKGIDYFDGAPGQDGKDGQDGYTPIKGVDYFDGAKGDPGPQGVPGVQGDPGPKGDPGNDYVLTQADKEEIAGMVDVPVIDVQVNGVSIVSSGVANFPTATASQVKTGTSTQRPLTPGHQHEATFYGLAKAAGDTTQASSSGSVGVYTETARSKIHQMFDNPVAVSGGTPSVTAMAGICYVCGEVSTVTITPCASGTCEIRFTSGSTAAVMSVSGVTWPEWFDPTALEANRIYDLLITDASLGMVMSWPA